LVFLIAFTVGILLRMGNPDLWHPVNGGEKPIESFPGFPVDRRKTGEQAPYLLSPPVTAIKLVFNPCMFYIHTGDA